MKPYKSIFREMAYSRERYKKLLYADVKDILTHLIKIGVSRKDIADSLHPELFEFIIQFRKGWQSTVTQRCYDLLDILESRKLKNFSGTKESVLKETVDDADIRIPVIVTECTNKFKHADKVEIAIYKIAREYHPISLKLEWYLDIFNFVHNELSPTKNKIMSLSELDNKLNEFYNEFLKD
ncbi:MAG TPA: hypothetical protein P5115_15215 [Spirochaetota bacterium]|nr:hypothetical protein [Spirochaetota bacterium]